MDAAGLAVVVLIFVLWLYFWLPASMAAKRGRSALGWVILTFIFSPLVTIIALLVLGPTFAHAMRSLDASPR